jgi:hypothetical protein
LMPAVADTFDREVDPQQQIRHFLSTVRRAWLTLLTCLGLGLLIGVAAFLWVPKSWTSTAKVQLKSTWLFEEADPKANRPATFAERRSQLEDQLRSSTWVEAALDKLEWPEWSRANVSREERAKFVERVKQHLRASVSAGELGERNVFVSFSWSDRHRAADFCEAILRVWLDSAVTNYLDSLNRRVSDGQRLLAQKRDDLARSQEALERFEMLNGISAINQHQSTQVRADQLRGDLDTLGATIAALQAQVDAYDAQLAQKGEDGAPLIPPTLEGTALISDAKAAQLAQLQQDLQELELLRLEHFTEKWPRVQTLHEELAQLLVTISADAGSTAAALAPQPNPRYESIKTLRDGVNLDLQGQLAAKAYSEARLKEAEDVLRTLPQVLRQYGDLELAVASAKQSVLDQQQALAPDFDKKTLADAKGPSELLPYSRLETPVPAPKPTSSVGWLVLAVSVLLGVGTAVAIVIGRELLRTSFAHADQTRQTLKLPVLGEVAPIQTAQEMRHSRFHRQLQVAASIAVLGGLAAMIVVCVIYPDHLPAGLVRWALDLRDALV